MWTRRLALGVTPLTWSIQAERRCNGPRSATLGLGHHCKGTSGESFWRGWQMSETALRELLDQRVVVLDGAWGSLEFSGNRVAEELKV